MRQSESTSTVPEKQGNYAVGRNRPPKHSQFKKGQSGNPGGVAKGTVYVSEAYKRMLAMSPEQLQKYKPKSVAEEIAMRQAKDAMGDGGVDVASLPAAKEIADRTEGKAPQTVNLNGNLANTETARLIIEEAISALVKLSAAAGVALSHQEAHARIQELQRSETLQLASGEVR